MNEEDNENADDLQFGEEFDDDVHCLTNDEIYLLLLRKQTVDNQSDTFLQTLSYAETVATTPIEEDLKNLSLAVSERLASLELERRSDRMRLTMHKYEMMSLANFVKTEDTTVEEVLCWIPSLYTYIEEDIMKAIRIVVEEKQRIEKA